MHRPRLPAWAFCFDALRLCAVGSEQLCVSRKIVCPVACQAPLALGPQRGVQSPNNDSQRCWIAAGNLVGPQLYEAGQVALAVVAGSAVCGMGSAEGSRIDVQVRWSHAARQIPGRQVQKPFRRESACDVQLCRLPDRRGFLVWCNRQQSMQSMRRVWFGKVHRFSAC